MGTDALEPGSSPAPPPANSTTIGLVVGGMHCQSCAALIEETLVRDHRVQRAEVDLDAARALVAFDASRLSVDDLCAVVVSAGYTAVPLASGDPAS